MTVSISEAINAVTEDDVDETTEAESTEETTSDGASGESILDGEDEETEETEEPEEEPAEEEPAEESDEAEDDSEDDSEDIFDQVTPEQMAEIKSNPSLNKLRKALMRSYGAKTSAHSQLVQIGQAYQKDPVGVLKAMAQQLGMEVKEPTLAEKAQAAASAPDPEKELEELFGEQIGPKVRAVFDRYVEAKYGKALAPVKQSLEIAETERKKAYLASVEQDWRERNKDLTPEIIKEVVDLGNSKKVVPGANMTPGEFLDTLTEIVMAKRTRQTTKKTQVTASKVLAKKIEANRRDREPSGISGRGSNIKKVSKIPQARNISEALDLAIAELEAEEGR